jgi:hypothetical protein
VRHVGSHGEERDRHRDLSGDAKDGIGLVGAARVAAEDVVGLEGANPLRDTGPRLDRIR